MHHDDRLGELAAVLAIGFLCLKRRTVWQHWMRKCAAKLRRNCATDSAQQTAQNPSFTFACMSDAANNTNAMDRRIAEGEPLITLAEAARRLPRIHAKQRPPIP